MISWFMGSSRVSGSVLTAWSLEPAFDFVSPFLSAVVPADLSVRFRSKAANTRLGSKHFFFLFNVYFSERTQSAGRGG